MGTGKENASMSYISAQCSLSAGEKGASGCKQDEETGKFPQIKTTKMQFHNTTVHILILLLFFFFFFSPGDPYDEKSSNDQKNARNCHCILASKPT